MRHRRNLKTILFAAALFMGGLVFLGPLAAMDFQAGENTKIDCDVSLTYGAGWRVSDRDMNSLTMTGRYTRAYNGNWDDGNWNFDKWDMINNKFTMVVDLDINHRDKFGLFVRPKAFYDFVYMGHNENPNDPRQLINNTLGNGNKYNEWDDEVESNHGANAEILDIFAYSSFDVGKRLLEVRVGRQVINWGESLFIAGGVSTAQTYMDLVAAVSPGVELKEVYLPAGAVYGQIDVLENLAFSTYYQWEWQSHRMYDAGTFFSTRDTLGQTNFKLSNAIPNMNDDEPSDSGQFGVALHTMVERLNNTEFGLYFSNYHEKWNSRLRSNHPLLAPDNSRPFPTNPLQYWLDYAEDIKMYGASFSTEAWDANIAGEISYHQGGLIRVGEQTRGLTEFDYQEGNYYQIQVSTIRGFSSPKYCDSSTIAAEVAWNTVPGLENEDLYYDKTAWSYRFTYTSSWLQVLQDLDLKVPISYTGYPDGWSSVTGWAEEGSDTVGLGLEFTYKNAYLFNIRYTNNVNSVRNERADRDYMTVDLKYTF